MTPSSAEALRGHDPEAVIAAIWARHARRTAGDFSPDGRKLGLVLEGGSLAAACSAGGAVVLAQLGFSHVFDEVYATSAAVMNAAYFVSNQPLLGISVYFDDCPTRAFVNPWRFWKIVDVDYIFDHVAVREKPLAVDRVLSAPTTLFVAVVDRKTGEGRMVNTKETRTPLLQVLKASASLPVFYNRAVVVDGRPCIDGGLAVPFGLREALANGCTDVLVLSNRQADYVGKAPSAFDRLVFELLCARGNRALSRLYAVRHLRAAELRDVACGLRPPEPGNARIATICAGKTENLPRLRASRAALHAAATSFGKRTLRIFGGRAENWYLPEDCRHADPALSRDAAPPRAGDTPGRALHGRPG